MSMLNEDDSMSLDSEGQSLSGRKSVRPDLHVLLIIQIFQTYIHIYSHTRFRWASNFDYIMTNLIYSISVSNYTTVLNVGPDDPNIIQYLICLFLIGMPLQYMQVALGQYTQLGGTNLKHLSPIGHGIGYCFIMTTLYRLIPISVMAGDFLLYLLNSLQKTMPWLKCNPKYSDICWDGQICEESNPCINDKVQTSAFVYWNMTFMKMDDTDSTRFSGLDLRRLVTCTIMWVVLYFILVYTMNLLKQYMRYFLMMAFCIVAILLCMLMIFGTNSYKGITYILDIRLNQFTEAEIWTNAVTDIVIIMNLSKGGYILFGSYLHPTTSSGILTVISIIAYTLVAYMFSFIFHICLALVVNNSNLPNKDAIFAIQNVYTAGEFIIIPQGLGLYSVPQLWCVLYFFSSIIICITYILINIRVIEISFEDTHPNFFRYRKYMLFAFLLICPLASVSFVCSKFHKYSSFFYIQALNTFDTLIAFIFTLLVAWIYGVQKLCDDIHFITGGQPTKFWKICWYIMPLILGVASLLEILGKKHSWNVFSLLILVSLLCPLFALALIETFKYIKKRNLVGLFQPEERWGPPDTNERHLRNVFNPRKEIRSRRRNEACQHKCLLNSNVLKRVIAEETKYHMYNTDLEDFEQFGD